MRHVRGLALFFAMVAASGCASSSALETQIQQLRSELTNRMNSRETEMREEIKREGARSVERIRKENTDIEARLRKEQNDLETRSRKELADFGKSVQSDLSALREEHKKYTMETDKALLDHQKQIFQSKTVLEDSARRVYLLENLSWSKSMAVPQQIREGYVTFVEGNKAFISLGNVNGVKAGDRFEVVKNNEKIGFIEIEAVERETSQGTILPESKKISIGDKVESGKQK